ncbi:hypothetical protein C2E23DRAFT_901756, partial [Lenzites betulinus]
MARTKQTASRSTGGDAPLRALSEPARQRTLAAATSAEKASRKQTKVTSRSRRTTSRRQTITTPQACSKDANEGIERHDNFCFICQNGGDTIECSNCPRVMCFDHVPIVKTITAEQLQDIWFLCTACHAEEEYRPPKHAVCLTSSQKAGTDHPRAYIGFYHVKDGIRTPVFDRATTFVAKYTVGRHA